MKSYREDAVKIVMLGVPGAGKGTQAIELATKYEIPHISTGDIFRANIKKRTELGEKAKCYIEKGLLVPDELTCNLMVERIGQADCVKGYVLDGFPRTIPQAESLDAALAAKGQKLNHVINVEVPDECIIKRMSGRRACLTCGKIYHLEHIPPVVAGICDRCEADIVLRDDDAPETVKRRLNTYYERTQPLIDYYKKTGTLRVIDGTRDKEEVFQAINAILGE